jgi:polyisoprenoid-binding protein YceI
MAYIINKTTGEILITLDDGTADGPDINAGQNVADIDLFGKNYPLYGQYQNENFIKLLQNFASTIAPQKPLQGELWYDLNTGLLKVYTGTSFIPVSPVIVSSTAPITSVVGTQWWDYTNQQLNLWNGSTYTVVGPAYKAVDGKSGAIVEDVLDTLGATHTIIKFYTNNNVLAISSYDQSFTLSPANPITGFSVISPGFTLAAEANNLFYGTATNAQQLGNIAAANYARNDIDSTFHGNINIGGSNLAVTTTALSTRFTNNALNSNISFYINLGSISTRALSINGVTGEVTVNQNPTTASGIVTKEYSDASIATAVAPLAPLYSPALLGTPTVPNVVVASTNTAQIASMAAVQNAIANGNTAPWLGSQKIVSTAAPTNGIGNPGDFWFQI